MRSALFKDGCNHSQDTERVHICSNQNVQVTCRVAAEVHNEIDISSETTSNVSSF